MPPPPQLCTPCTHLFTRKKSHNLLGAITTTHTFQRSLLATSTCPLCSELHWLVSKQQSRGLFRDLRRKDGDDVEVKFKYFESRDVGVGVRVTVDGVEEHHFRISVREGQFIMISLAFLPQLPLHLFVAQKGIPR